MFTGIIECIGKVENVELVGTNYLFTIQSELSTALKIDQSVAHDGVCLTVVQLDKDTHTVCAIAETIDKTNLGNWKKGFSVNLERAMLATARLDGHFVQGHVDAQAKCIEVLDKNGSWEYTFEIEQSFAHLIIEKGSVTINGTSLTCFNVSANSFKVAIIPYTYEHTTIHQVQVGTNVNIEFDIVGKYLQRYIMLHKQ